MNSSSVGDQLVHDVILLHAVAVEVARHVDEGGEAPGGEAFEPL